MSTGSQVLALKYRPKTFDDVVGQEAVTRTLKNAIASGRLGHAFLLSGARGVGKTTTARILARALNCVKGPTPDPCGECSSCTEVSQSASMDVQEIDGATNNSVDDVRELRESARYKPARDRFKVWIIDEVHMLSSGAFNALLKTLEEPPPQVKFIFATTEYHKLPETILSRCQQYDFRMIPTQGLLKHLRKVATAEEIGVSDKALEAIARAAEGSARDALSLFDQVLSFSTSGRDVRDEDLPALLGLVDRELLLGASSAVASGDTLALLELVEKLSEYGADYRTFARELLLHLREVLVLKLAPDESRLLVSLVPEERERLRPLVEAFSEEDLVRFFDILTEAGRRLADKATPDPRITLELALLKMAQTRRLVPFAELVARMETLAGGPGGHDEPHGGRGPAPRRVQAPAAGRDGSASRSASDSAVAAPRSSSAPAPSDAPVGSSAPGAAARAAAASVREVPAATESAAADDARPDAAPGDELLAEMLAAAGPRPSLTQPLRGATLVRGTDGMELQVSPDFLVLAESHADEYRELASKVLGRPAKLRVVAVAPAAALPPTEAEIEKNRLRERAEADPAVREAMGLFDGRLLDVRPPRA